MNICRAGMVAQCSGCDSFPLWAAVLMGIFGGFAYLAVHFIMLKFGLDDPLDAVAVHGGGGKHQKTQVLHEQGVVAPTIITLCT